MTAEKPLEPVVLEGEHVRLDPGLGVHFATGGRKILSEGRNRP